MHQRKLIIGSRGSDLALWQANFVLISLTKLGYETEIKIIETKGDRIQDVALNQISGIGFFTKEIEEALLNSEIDIAVHSNKDLPTVSPIGLKIAAVSNREDPSELLIIRKEAVDIQNVLSLKIGARVGTSSPRRRSQLLSFRDDLIIDDLRGNVPTRVNKLRDKKYDAIILAAAGIYRLNLSLAEFHVEKLSPKMFIPAPAQGVLALQIREQDEELTEILLGVNVKEVESVIKFERTILNKFEGGCHIALGAYTVNNSGVYCTWISKSDHEDKVPARIYLEGTDPDIIAEMAIKKLNNIKPTSVFISRELDDNSYFKKNLSAYHYKVTGKSLITTSQIKIESIPNNLDWVFFSSSKAVHHFFNQEINIPVDLKFAAIGQSTAEALNRFKIVASFVGKNNEMSEVGKEFAETVKNKRILFPKSKQSLRTIQRELLDENDVLELNVYETKHIEEIEKRDEDILVFTSPSNVEAYFGKHKLNEAQKVIAIGSSTNEKLNNFNIFDVVIASVPNEIGLTEAVFGL
ncbi:MAG: hydroxymethylbilane synthase [Bacteroidia bacterium]